MSTNIEDIKEVVTRGEILPGYYECGCCGSYHPAQWDGDCRDDANRFALDQLDEKHGAFGWLEVDQPEIDLNEMQEADLRRRFTAFREGRQP